MDEASGNVSPQLENTLIEEVEAFEKAYAKRKQLSIFELLGEPEFIPASELADAEIVNEFERLNQLLSSKNIHLKLLGEYSDRTIYSFIVNELFHQQTDDIQLPGLVRNFTYEDFHPDHSIDIRNRTLEFLGNWFERKTGEYNWPFAETLVLANERLLTREEVLIKLITFFSIYTSFTECKYAIAEIDFQVDEETETGLGYAAGGVIYNAHTPGGEQIHFEGPFKLHLSYRNNWWSIFYFAFPGFNW